jgi:hypothetical protein
VDFNTDGFVDICAGDCIFGGTNVPNTGTNSSYVLASGGGSKGMSRDWIDVGGDGSVDYCRRTNDGVDQASWRLESYMNLRGSFSPVMSLVTLPYIEWLLRCLHALRGLQDRR